MGFHAGPKFSCEYTLPSRNTTQVATIVSALSVSVSINANGIGTVALGDADGKTFVSKENIQVGHGPFYLILGQRRGLPSKAGLKEPVWSSVEVQAAGAQTGVLENKESTKENHHTDGSGGKVKRRVAPPSISGISPSKGSAGTTITITGLGFCDVTAVTLGGTRANYTVLSQTTIRVTVPDVSYADNTIKTLGPGSQVEVTVTVKTASGSANSLFNYTGPK